MSARSITLSRDDFEKLKRVHVTNPKDWSIAVGTDYWYKGGGKDFLTGSKPNTLADFGWTTTTNVNTAGSVENFMAHVASANPSATLPTASSSVLASPAVFGDYDHAAQAANLLQRKNLPDYLICDIYGAFTTNSAAEKMSGFGFLKGAGAPLTSADNQGFIYSDATNFQLDNGNANTSTTTAVDTKYHRWRIVLDRAAAASYFYMDGVKLGANVALQAARYPLKFVLGMSTTNVVALGSAHIYYQYRRIPQDWGQAAV